MKNYRQIMDLDNMTVEDYQQVNRINYLAAIINDGIVIDMVNEKPKKIKKKEEIIKEVINVDSDRKDCKWERYNF